MTSLPLRFSKRSDPVPERYEKSAKPFEWTFTRRDLHDLLAKLNTKSDHLAA